MVNRFQQQFGKPETTVIAIGDYRRNGHMSGHEPSRGIGFRTMFRKCGYQVFLVDEFQTSCRCCQCQEGVCKNVKTRLNPRPFRNGTVKIHALLRCQNESCGVWWNRDVNGAKNIWRIADCAVKGLERPVYLQRSNQSSDNTNLPTSFTTVS